VKAIGSLLLKADARRLDFLPDGCVQCCVTSPPFFGLRDYGHDRQIGLEPSPDEFVAGMVAVFRGVRRVMREDATLFLNLGDSYAGSWGNQGRLEGDGRGTQRSIACDKFQPNDGRYPRRRNTGAIPEGSGLKPKDLCGIPWRVALALQADGWYLRCDIIWSKPNPMPESVTDRPTKAHEYLFLLTKSPTYYYDADAIREPVATATIDRDLYSRVATPGTKGFIAGEEGILSRATLGLGGEHRGPKYAVQHDHETPSNPLGRNKRSVWTVDDPLMMLRPDLSPEQRAYVIGELLRRGGL
jgi:hypothetical protein